MKLAVDGLEPLIGQVRVSGSRNASLAIIAGSLFSNEDVVLENVPRIGDVEADLEVIQKLGAKVSWGSDGKLTINASDINSYEISKEESRMSRTVGLLTGPLLYRFGKAVLPIPMGSRPMNRWVSSWEELGFEVKNDEKDFLHIEVKTPKNSEIVFRIGTVTGTENAILSSLFIPGDTVISNAASEPAVDDLLAFLSVIGATVKRVEESKIIVSGGQYFTGGKYKIIPDRLEAATLAAAALVTCGDITINDAVSSHLLPFIRKLEAMGAHFEFKPGSLRVWRNRGEELRSIGVETGEAPGFWTDWQPLMTLILTQSRGSGLVHDTIFTNRFEYAKELNRMGAHISLLRPSEAGLSLVISDDSYNIEKLGEPLTVARVEGPTLLKHEKLEISDFTNGAVLILAALAADGRSEIYGAENINRGFENFFEKISKLGAHVEFI